MARFHLTVGDHGPLATIGMFHLTDATGQPITTGQVQLAASGLFIGDMDHHGDGVWSYTPQEGDITVRATHRMDVLVAGEVALPAAEPHQLIVRDRAAVAA